MYVKGLESKVKSNISVNKLKEKLIFSFTKHKTNSETSKKFLHITLFTYYYFFTPYCYYFKMKSHASQMF